ncbi:hypothetical protein NPIL_156211 [Nephila pilipes]|uniref:Uncharacterized protein n=1 Tax=Nephila pilipes TaxID=299642 RepID=A0A8X6UL89_NEPPI|nr:hypothetical protein NPIL_156211 [Nephila pilipes]
MKYEFHRRATTRQAVANINSVFDIQVATNVTVAHWSNFVWEISTCLMSHGCDSRLRWIRLLKATMEANFSQIARELSLVYNVSKQTILTHLTQIAKQMTLIPLHDNARSHAARMTVSKLQELKLETLRHPPYLPDLAS